MLAKLFQKSSQIPPPQPKEQQGSLTSKDFDPRVAIHYGIPSTASILAYDPFQHLLAIGTLDGRIKVIGGDNIEGLLIAPKPLPFKNLEFLQNQGLLVSVSNENEIQVWDLENRILASCLQWESNITAFSVIYGTHYMYIGDEYGYVSSVKYDAEERKVIPLPYHIPANLLAEAAEISLADHQSVVGLLPQPCSFGNRVLIAYDNGLIILWDLTEDRAVLVKCSKDLQLKDKCLVDSPNDDRRELLDNSSSDIEQAEKEISSLCWVSSDGSILAVGYVDGDILLWNLSLPENSKDQTGRRSSNDVIKLQLSSGDRRLPVIVLHWSSSNTRKGCKGQLFVYGGDQIGSDEVLTILSLDWSSGIANLKCIDRVDLPLSGSFADMTLLTDASEKDKLDSTSLFVLTNPGQLHFYDTNCLSLLQSEPEKKHSVHALQYPAVVPTIEPHMTVGKLLSLGAKGKFSRDLLKAIQSVNVEKSQWPLTGGVPSHAFLVEDNEIERVFVAGYQDGSVRIWDATYPVLSLIYVFGAEVVSAEVSGATAPVSALDLSSTLIVAAGNECGLVFLYKLEEQSNKTSLYTITEAKHEVTTLQGESHCAVIFSLLKSPVCTLQFVPSGERLAVAFECGQVAMLDTGSMSVLFLTGVCGSTIISLFTKTFADYHSSDNSGCETLSECTEIAFLLGKDAHIVLMDSTSGNIFLSERMLPNGEVTALSLNIIEDNSSEIGGPKDHKASSPDTKFTSEQGHQSDPIGVEHPVKADLNITFLGSQLLLCCEDAVYLYSLKSVVQGTTNFVLKVELDHPCAWTSILKKDGKVCGLIIVYLSGEVELRSLPDLEVIGQATLESILRWNFKANMEKTMSSSDKGLITLVNGGELAFVSLLNFENDLRLPESLPCLHDKVLEAATDPTVSFSGNQKEDQDGSSGAFAGILKGFKGVKPGQHVNHAESHENLIAHLESILSRFPFSDLSLNINLDIDDIEIDEPAADTSSLTSNNVKMASTAPDKETERARLLEGGSIDSKPRVRTREEIIAKYRNTGDATSAAAQAKDKLIERQEKLERLSMRTEELQSGAQSFAEMANELAKRMEKRKWWHI